MWLLGFYMNRSSVVHSSCTQCDCDSVGTIPDTTCDHITGQCQCVQGDSGVGGLSCDSCLPGYWKGDRTNARLLHEIHRLRYLRIHATSNQDIAKNWRPNDCLVMHPIGS